MHRITEPHGIIGTVTIRSYRKGTLDLAIPYADEAKALLPLIRAHEGTRYGRRLEARRRHLVARMREILQEGSIGTPCVNHNLIVYYLNAGYDVLVQFLLSAYTGSFAFANTLGVAWGEIGTGTTQPTTADSALTSPVSRAPVSYGADSGFSTAQLQFFFPDAALPNQTYNEFGTFIGGTSSLGTGGMFNHALFTNPYSKSSGVDTTVECDFEFAPQNAAQFDSAQFT